jgi:hypothetical protein
MERCFSALSPLSLSATVSHTYRFRAYNDDYYLDTELILLTGGFPWDYGAGPAHVQHHLPRRQKRLGRTEATIGRPPAAANPQLLLHRGLCRSLA